MIMTKYITIDEFKDYTGIDLLAELNTDNANPSDTANRFLKRVEDRMELYVNNHFFIQIPTIYPTWDDRSKKCYKLALIEQAEYMFRNGDIAMDSGYNPDNLSTTDLKRKNAVAMSKVAYDYLISCGFNREIGYGTGVIGLWGYF